MVKSGNSLKSDISKEVDYENVADEFAFIKARKKIIINSDMSKIKYLNLKTKQQTLKAWRIN